MNQPRPEFDRLLKAAAEEEPRALLDVLGILPATVEARVDALTREIITPLLKVDQLYRIEYGARKWVEHLEFQAQYRAVMGERMLYYAVAAVTKHRLPIYCVLVLLDPRQAPKEIPEYYELSAGGLRARLDFPVVRFWELEAARLLGYRRLLPWVFLAKSDEHDREEAATRVAALGDRKLAAEFVLVGQTRYDRNYVLDLLGRHGMGLLPLELFKNTDWWQDAVRQGREEGQIEMARRHVDRVLKDRYPGLEFLSELDRIAGCEQLEAIFELAIGGADRPAIEAAIKSAVTQSPSD